MSRYLQLAVPSLELEAVAAALTALGLAHARGELMLEGSLECAGEPVAIRLPAGSLGTVEDFGFVVRDGATQLVCGELDRDLLEAELLPRLQAAAMRDRLVHADLDARLETGPDGRPRIVLRR